MNIAVGTKNVVKLRGIMQGFRQMGFEVETSQITVEEVSSDVPNQPFGDDVFKGAKNRALKLRNIINSEIFVGCEGGIIYQYGTYFNVQVVYIITSAGQETVGISSALPIPEAYIPEIRKSNFANVADEKVQGGLAKLTCKFMDREKAIMEATVMALTTFKHKSWSLNIKS